MPSELRIVEQVRAALTPREPTEHHRERMLEGIGRRTIEVGHSVLGHVNLLGAAVIGIGYSILHPHTVRMRD